MASTSAKFVNVDAVQERKLQYKMVRMCLTAKALPPALFLHGLPSSGKSFIIEKVLEECKTALKARISAAEAMCGKRAFFETIVRQLITETDEKQKLRCESSQMFVRVLQEHFERSNKQVIVVVENCELISSEQHMEILTALLLAHDTCGVNICFVFSSTIPFLSFTAALGGLVKSVPKIYFPQYSKEEIISIICREPPKNADSVTYKFYVSFLVDVFYRSCRELRKLKRLAIINYSSFASSIPDTNVENDGSTPKPAKNKELHKLWKKIEPKLKSDFVTLNSQFMQISSEPKPSSRQISIEVQPSTSSASALAVNSTSTSKLVYDLPECSKYILIAAFIASNNPPTSDKRFFVKAKMKNTTVAAAKKRFTDKSAKTNNHTAKVFSYNRLQAIFSAICSTSFFSQGRKRSIQSAVMDTAHMSQIMTLCDARLISVSGTGGDSLENRKFKCLADIDLVSAISQSVDFELSNFLFEML